jgi:hypothetical protein
MTIESWIDEKKVCAKKSFEEIKTLKSVKIAIHSINSDYVLESEKYRKRISELESKISEDPEISVNYALYMNERFIKAEENIKKNPKYATEYAIQILNSRWPEAESLILNYIKYSVIYTEKILKERWIDFENKIISKQKFEDEHNFKYVINYMDLFKLRIYEIEEILGEKLNALELLEYWKYHVSAGRLPNNAHNKLLAASLNDSKYIEYFDILKVQKTQFLSYLKSLRLNQNSTIKELEEYVARTSI